LVRHQDKPFFSLQKYIILRIFYVYFAGLGLNAHSRAKYSLILVGDQL